MKTFQIPSEILINMSEEEKGEFVKVLQVVDTEIQPVVELMKSSESLESDLFGFFLEAPDEVSLLMTAIVLFNYFDPELVKGVLAIASLPFMLKNKENEIQNS